jgi:hypothetical protein
MNESDRLKQLREALRNARESDIEYRKENVPTHTERREKKIGFKPVSVFGNIIPEDTGVVFVEGHDAKGPLWYVISHVDGRRRESEVSSRDEARRAVLTELQAWATRACTKPRGPRGI